MQKRDTALIDEVIETERRWVQAHRDLDIVALENLLAEDYVQIRPDGSVVGKLAVLESYRSGNRRWDQADSDQYRVSVLGDVANLIGRWVGRGENEGEPFDYTARFLTIYVKRDGRWQLAADQSTPLD
jgi:ketosteroid isomerase-like protein